MVNGIDDKFIGGRGCFVNTLKSCIDIPVVTENEVGNVLVNMQPMLQIRPELSIVNNVGRLMKCNRSK
jgi:hypothetical protein